MIVALDKHGVLSVYVSAEDAERGLEAVDVREEGFEFSDPHGQRYSAIYTRPPKNTRPGLVAVIDIGAFRLVPQGEPEPALLDRLLGRAERFDHSSFPAITSTDALREEIRRRTGPMQVAVAANGVERSPVAVSVSANGRNFPEADWKLFRQLQPVALQRYCERVLQETKRVIEAADQTPHDRLLALGNLVRRRDSELARGFYDMRRSTAFIQLVVLRSYDVITEEEYLRFSPETRKRLAEAFEEAE